MVMRAVTSPSECPAVAMGGHSPEWMASHHGGPLNRYVCVECCATLPFPPSRDEPRPGPGLREATRVMVVEMHLAATLNTIGRLWEPGAGREDSIRVAVDDALDDLERG